MMMEQLVEQLWEELTEFFGSIGGADSVILEENQSPGLLPG